MTAEVVYCGVLWAAGHLGACAQPGWVDIADIQRQHVNPLNGNAAPNRPCSTAA